MHPDEQISVWTEYVFSFDDLPNEVQPSFRDAFADYELNNGDRLLVEQLIEYMEKSGKTEELDIFTKFRMNNDIEDSYYIEMYW